MTTPVQHRPALWQQLQRVSSVLQSIRQGQSATAVLAAVAAPERPGVQALSFAVLRMLGRAEALRKLLAPRKPPPAVDALLCVALALLVQGQDGGYDAFTLVNQAVEAAKKTAATRAQAGFVNACLRRFLREQAALMAQTDKDVVAHWNHPAWWVTQLQADWPDQWPAILAAANRPAPMVLRVNRRHTSQADYLQTLRASGVDARPVGEWGVALSSACPVQQLPGFAQGWVSVQDGAAQLAAPLLLNGMQLGPEARVLDACAAPGGKTAHLLELADLQVTALDIDQERCSRIHQTLERVGLQARVIAADAADVQSWWDGEPFDAILLDAPCSASGIVRRHPDIRWLRRSSDIAQLAAIQARLLRLLWPLLKPGGRLLYCTCSVFRAEGALQTTAFLASNAQATLLPSPGHLWPSGADQDVRLMDNPLCDHDGFYYALLHKSGA